MKHRSRLLAALGLDDRASEWAIKARLRDIPDLATRAHVAIGLFGEEGFKICSS